MRHQAGLQSRSLKQKLDRILTQSGLQRSKLRSLLRDRTRAAHERVDRVFSRHDLWSAKGYVAFLRQHASVVLPMERMLDRAPSDHLIDDWPSRRRSTALRSDLTRLSEPVPPFWRELKMADPAELLGAMYVLEGSRLGARVLLTRVEAAGNPATREATAFLRHGTGAPFWPSFINHLEASPYADAKADRIVAGALTVFALFEQPTDPPRFP